VRRAFERVLAERGVSVHRGAEVAEVAAGRLQVRDGATLDADEIVWVTQAGGAAWLRDTGLALDGRLHPRPRHPAKRDRSADLRRRRLRRDDRPPLEKAGVFAVRMGRRWPRTCAAACSRAAASYRPQRAGWR
jgi:selenide,water dikinase